MSARQTEMIHASGRGFDILADEDALAILAQGQVDAAQVVKSAIPAIAQAARAAANTIAAGGKLVYAAAGSSGLMAMADALELPGTYGINRRQISILFAGGFGTLRDFPGGPEDDADGARADVAAERLGPGDCVLAVAASGSTPYPVAALEAARATGAATIGLANNPDVPLFAHADIAICLPTPAEVVAGSTRMGAGTAQKIALNMFSTLMATRLGHVHDGFMVGVIADNLKLRQRAAGIIVALTGVETNRASQAIETANGAVKEAILLAAGAANLATAQQLLAEHNGHLRPALTALRG